MTIKSAMDADGGVATETMADRLRNVQTETWQRLEWVHDEAELAWEAYNECLLLRSGGGVAAPAVEGEEGKGKGKEPAAGVASAAGDESGAADLVEKVTRLRTDWGEQELLQAVSGVAVADGGGAEAERGEVVVGKGKGTVVKMEEQAEGQKVSGRAGRSTNAASGSAPAAAGTAVPRRGARRGATRGSAMEID